MSIVKNFIINRFATSHQESDAAFEHPPGSPLKKFTKEQYSLVIGNGLRGKLGVGYTRHLTSLTKHEELPEGIIHLQCGDLHAVSLTDFAQISTWGSNEFGQLGYDTSTLFCKSYSHNRWCQR
jgi:alpha-tubulin suppressor-like RCC1 family protein